MRVRDRKHKNYKTVENNTGVERLKKVSGEKKSGRKVLLSWDEKRGDKKEEAGQNRGREV